MLIFVQFAPVPCEASFWNWLRPAPAATPPSPPLLSPHARHGEATTPSTSFTLEPFLAHRLEEGRKRLEELELDGATHECWSNAVDFLVTQACRSLGYEHRARIALKLAACHLAKAGVHVADCAAETPLERCLAPLAQSAVAFGTYNTFFTHSDNICFYAQQEAFQKGAEHAVQSLFTAVLATASHLRAFHDDSVRLTTFLHDSLKQQHEHVASQLEELAEEETARFARLASVGTELGQRQETLLQGQRALREDVDLTLQSVHTRADELAGRMTVSLQQQMRLEAGQQGALDRLQRVQTGQETLQADMKSALTSHRRLHMGQRVLTVRQQQSLAVSDQLLSGQRRAVSQLNAVQNAVGAAQAQLHSLHSLQEQSFEETHTRLERVVEQSKEAEERVSSLLGAVLRSLDLLASLDGAILQQVFSINTSLYSVAAVVVACVLTTLQRTRNARWPLLLVLALGFACEHTLLRTAAPQPTETTTINSPFAMVATVQSFVRHALLQLLPSKSQFAQLPTLALFLTCVHEPLQNCGGLSPKTVPLFIAVLRKLCWSVAFVLLLHAVVTFRDYTRESFQAVQQLQSALHNLHPSTRKPSSFWRDEVNAFSRAPFAFLFMVPLRLARHMAALVRPLVAASTAVLLTAPLLTAALLRRWRRGGGGASEWSEHEEGDEGEGGGGSAEEEEEERGTSLERASWKEQFATAYQQAARWSRRLWTKRSPSTDSTPQGQWRPTRPWRARVHHVPRVSFTGFSASEPLHSTLGLNQPTLTRPQHNNGISYHE